MNRSLIFLFFVAIIIFATASPGIAQTMPSVITVDNAAKLTLTRRLGGGEGVDVKFSPDGKKLAVVDSVGLHLIDPATAKELWFKDFQPMINHSNFSKDGKTILGVTSGGEILAWDAETGKQQEKSLMPAKVDLIDAHLSQDAQHLVTENSFNQVAVYHIGEEKPVATQELFKSYNLWSAQVAPDGETFMVVGWRTAGGYQLQMQLWNTADNKFLLGMRGAIGMRGYVGTGAFSMDGALFGVSDYTREGINQVRSELFVWDAKTGKLLNPLVVVGDLSAFNFFPGGKSAIIGQVNGKLESYDIDKKSVTLTYEGGDPSAIAGLAVSPDGKMIAAGHINGVVDIWNAEQSARERSIALEASRAIEEYHHLYESTIFIDAHYAGFALTPDGKQIARTTPGMQAVELIDMKTGKAVKTFKLEEPAGTKSTVTPTATGKAGQSEYKFSPNAVLTLAAISPDGKMLASVLDSTRLVLWSINSGKVLRIIQTPAKRSIKKILFSPDNKSLVSLGSDQVFLWNPNTGEKITSVSGYLAMDFSPDSKLIVTDNVDYGLYFWDATSGKQVKVLPAEYIYAVSYAPDGKTVAVGSYQIRKNTAEHGKLVYFVNTADYEQLPTELRDHLMWPVRVKYSPDGKLIVSVDYNGNMYLWDAISGKLLKQFAIIGPGPYTVMFTPDQKTLVVGSNDGVLQYYEVR